MPGSQDPRPSSAPKPSALVEGSGPSIGFENVSGLAPASVQDAGETALETNPKRVPRSGPQRSPRRRYGAPDASGIPKLESQKA